MSLSALGSALSGGGNLLSGVASLLPQTTSTKGHTEANATATSSSTGTQIEEGGSTTSSTSKGKTTNTGSQNESSNLRESNTSKSDTTVSQILTGVEQFSGQRNTSSSQLMLDEEGMMRIVNLMLAGQGGVEGLDSIVKGERAAGLFDSSTNQLLTSNLATTIAGEVAKLTAPTVTEQKLGSTTTTTSSSAESITRGITEALANSVGNRNLTSADTSITDVEELMSQLMSNVTNAFQDTTQTSNMVQDTTGKNKSKLSFCVITALSAGMLYSADLLTDIRAFRDIYLLPNNPDLVATYYKETPKYAVAMNKLAMDDYDLLRKRLNTLYLVPMAQASKEGNFKLAESLFKAYIKENRILLG